MLACKSAQKGSDGLHSSYARKAPSQVAGNISASGLHTFDFHVLLYI